MKTATKKEDRITAHQLRYSSASVVYKSEISGLWRGFVLPYDITYEASTREEVITVLREMVESYEDALRKYGHPGHLRMVPLSDPEDIRKNQEISTELMNNLLAGHSKVEHPKYYAEAKLPS